MASAMATADLHFIDPTKEETRVSAAWLSRTEKERAGQFLNPDDSRRWTVYRAALRRILGETLGTDPASICLTENSRGKPALADANEQLEFNLSHADDLAIVAISRNGIVGIDLEPWSRAESLLECADLFCHPDEMETLPLEGAERARRLLEIWTSKEALLKALGTGLSFPPHELRIEGDLGIADCPLDGLEKLRLLRPEAPILNCYRVALAVTNGTTDLKYHL